MKRLNFSALTVEQLIQQFADAALEQDEALLMNDIKEVNRLFWRLEAIEAELKSRDGDQRSALLSLYTHPNAQVRVKAAKATLAVAPGIARQMLEAVAASREYPQAGEAGMSIDALDDGIFKPS